MIHPVARIWAGLPDEADRPAIAEHALRYLIPRGRNRRWTKTDLLSSATVVCAQRNGRWPGNRHDLALWRPIVVAAWGRLVSAGVILWVPGKPLVFT